MVIAWPLTTSAKRPHSSAPEGTRYLSLSSAVEFTEWNMRVVPAKYSSLSHKNLILSFVLLLCAPALSHAATYYVDNSGSVACSDTGGQPGTAAAPFCTIEYGVSRISGGDTLYVKAGHYQPNGGAGYIIINGPSGTSAAHTSIRAYPGQTPIITGSSGGSGFRVQGASYMDVVGFEISGMEEDISVEGSNHILFDTLNVHDAQQACVHIRKCTSSSCSGTVPSYITIQNSNIHDCGLNTSLNGDGFYIGTSGDSSDTTNHVTVYNNTITNTGTECVNIKDFTNHTTVDHNTCDNNDTSNNQYSDAAIMLKSSTPTNNASDVISNNIISNTGPGSNCGASPSCTAVNSAIRLQHSATVFNNIIYGPNLASLGYAFYTENSDSRLIYQNTADVSSNRFINVATGSVPNIINNIGPNPSTYSNHNMAANPAYFVNYAGHDYHLVAGSAPIGAGANLLSVVPTDRDGNSRSATPDDGAYEYGGSSSLPQPPTGLSAIVH